MDNKNLDINETFALAHENYSKNYHKVAENLCQKILKINPNHFPSHFLLGLISVQYKNYKSAVYFFQKTIKNNHMYIPAYNNLGGVFKEMGKLKEAKNCYLKAIEIDPKYANAYYNLGNLLKEEGKFNDSITNYKKSIDLYKNDLESKKNQVNFVNVFYNLAGVHRELGKFNEAKDYYNKVIEINPNNERAQNNLGTVCKELGLYNEAVNCYKKAIKIKKDYALAFHNLGITYKLLGDFKNTILAYEKAIQYEPENFFHYYHLSDFKKEIINTELKNKVEKVINSGRTTLVNSAYGYFILSKFEQKNKKYKAELELLAKGHLNYYNATNEKFRKGVKYALEELPKIKKFTNFKNLSGNYNIKPIFIIGVPRCGSTLIEKVIAASDTNIPIGEETAVLSAFFEKQNLLNKKVLKKEDIEDFRNKLYDIYNQKKLISKKSNYIFTDKSLENFFYINLIKEIYPKAKIINCIRAPISSIVSILQNNLTGISWAHDIKQIFHYFDIYYDMIEHHNKNLPGFIYNLNFEKFVSNPEEESKSLIKFCSLKWDKKCLEFYKRKDVISQTASNIQVREAIYKSPKNKHLPYKEFLNEYGINYKWFN